MSIPTSNTTLTAHTGSLALIGAALFTLSRMLPVALSEGFHSGSLPPGQNAAQTAETALLGGWYVSHVMAMLTVPLLVYGFLAVYQEVRMRSGISPAERVTLAGFLILVVAGVLYLSGAALDGVALGHVSKHYMAASDAEKDVSGLIVMAVTESAASFGAHYMILTMIGTGVLAYGLSLAGLGTIQSLLGIAIGGLGLVGWLSGFFDITFQERLWALLGMIALTMLWWISLAVVMMRGQTFSAPMAR
ncbi:MAG: hypothetical protein ABJN39_19760 [Sulfitobacter sp.]|uniref:hypothetical protein n=1 Tax=Alphaproteobacteria TaxID=28211 RepID=UPI0029428402|nr:hypothetical protein [Sulfitobacter sp. LC.270.F.C4]WOI15219.1 hypothetical protein R1T45_19430 [Sulfitobacter sp. LC.270.F.C4]